MRARPVKARRFLALMSDRSRDTKGCLEIDEVSLIVGTIGGEVMF